nr:unnamed protein product [Callosobruchus chinensis]
MDLGAPAPVVPAPAVQPASNVDLLGGGLDVLYQELLGQLRRLWPDYTISLLVMVIGSLGGMRNTLLSALRVMPVCRAAAHILAARMQKAAMTGFAIQFNKNSFGIAPASPLSIPQLQPGQSLEYSLALSTTGPVQRMEPLTTLQVNIYTRFFNRDV